MVAAPPYRREGRFQLIEIGLKNVSQLFNSLDPSPFHEKDLDTDAENYIVGAAREISPRSPLKLVLHLPRDHFEQPGTMDLERSIQNYFAYRRDMAARDLRYLFRLGRTSMAVGLGFLASCVMLRQLAPLLGPPFDYVVAESLLIVGWVAMWRPIETFLYDWWPLRGTVRIYARLAAAPVEARPAN
jgi:hypothetical protein